MVTANHSRGSAFNVFRLVVRSLVRHVRRDMGDDDVSAVTKEDASTQWCSTTTDETDGGDSSLAANKRKQLHDWAPDDEPAVTADGGEASKKARRLQRRAVATATEEAAAVAAKNGTRPSPPGGTSDVRYNETSYYMDNGLRKVYPYYFTFTTYAKGRWVGRTLLDVFEHEFRAHTVDEYRRHIENGSLTVNDGPVPVDYELRHNDRLANTVHRHEVPVTAEPIGIVHVDSDVLVVNKPASVPVHPCGRYRHNTVVFLLAKERGFRDLKTVHRLDRLTSGVLMFARTRDAARRLEAQIRDRLVHKRYVCRVRGRFPDGGGEGQPVECNEPIRVVSHKIGVCKVCTVSGKPCRTTFRSAGYDERTDVSVVLCEPLSGRMHQIRVHLQYLGHPIVNDPLYNDPSAFGPDRGRGGHFGGKTDDQLISDLVRAHNAENWLSPRDDGSDGDVTDNGTDGTVAAAAAVADVVMVETATRDAGTQTGMDGPDPRFDRAKWSVDPDCPDCRYRYKDPEPKDLVMYLHAYEYSGPGWTYRTPLPAWADVDWTPPEQR